MNKEEYMEVRTELCRKADAGDIDLPVFLSCLAELTSKVQPEWVKEIGTSDVGKAIGDNLMKLKTKE